jgi:hypothetical protein
MLEPVAAVVDIVVCAHSLPPLQVVPVLLHRLPLRHALCVAVPHHHCVVLMCSGVHADIMLNLVLATLVTPRPPPPAHPCRLRVLTRCGPAQINNFRDEQRKWDREDLDKMSAMSRRAFSILAQEFKPTSKDKRARRGVTTKKCTVLFAEIKYGGPLRPPASGCI